MEFGNMKTSVGLVLVLGLGFGLVLTTVIAMVLTGASKDPDNDIHGKNLRAIIKNGGNGIRRL
ncbi:MAG: hypothetical protein K6T65_12005 [Peptococcaceae bacterium]|nr:hypothetical protein [Peptococcaceae bacterium]